MAQGKAGWWIAGICAGVILISVGYGMGRKASHSSSNPSEGLTPAGAPLPPLQIEPIQPHEELAAIAGTPAPVKTASATSDPTTPPSSATAPASAAPPKEESARVREIQQALKAAGFDPGTIDGRMGQHTKTAIHDFQVAQGLEPDGKVGPRTWSKLESFLNGSANTPTNTKAGASND